MIKAINKFLHYDEDTSKKNAPGVTNVIKLIVLMALACFLRMIFVSLQDV